MDFSREELCMIWTRFSPVTAWRPLDKLIGRYGSASALWDRFYDDEVRAEIRAEGWNALEEIRKAGADGIVRRLDSMGANAVGMNGPDYPKRLLNIQDPPKALFYKGKLPGDGMPGAAIIGARRDTRYGRQQAYRIARDLAAAGVVIVSGLARGIDSAAHLGALDGGGITAAVLGNGIRTVYPAENLDLAARIVASGGCVISEFAPDAPPLGYHFPIRNRIISGMSDAVILIEAQKKSGTATTINHALEQGKEIFALPGNVDSPGSELPLALLRDGAQMCTRAGDVIETMRWSPLGAQISIFDEEDKPKSPRARCADPVLDAILRDDKTFEELLDETGLEASELSARLTVLEIEGRIQRIGGRAYGAVRQP